MRKGKCVDVEYIKCETMDILTKIFKNGGIFTVETIVYFKKFLGDNKFQKSSELVTSSTIKKMIEWV